MSPFVVHPRLPHIKCLCVSSHVQGMGSFKRKQASLITWHLTSQKSGILAFGPNFLRSVFLRMSRERKWDSSQPVTTSGSGFFRAKNLDFSHKTRAEDHD